MMICAAREATGRWLRRVTEALLEVFSQSSVPTEAIFLYTHMEKSYVKPDIFGFPFLLKACSKLGSMFVGNQVLSRMCLRNSLIHLNAGSSSLEVARQLFDEKAQRDVVAWSAFTVGYARRGKIEDARDLFGRMPERDLISWNVMVTAYTLSEAIWSHGHAESALSLFEEMQRGRMVRPNGITFVGVLVACTHACKVEEGRRWITDIYSPARVDQRTVLWLRVFSPAGVSGGEKLPVVVFFHGGGFVYLKANSRHYDAVCRRIARRLRAFIVSVDYGLAPEHRFPTAYDDAEAAVKWISKPGRLPESADLRRFFLAGDSAGANIVHHF
ncbi:Pentatricopeptide repeat-containing protein [Nymphaea thermarum]|nr:Pentatricopeptide repeat-containing protein [Nymphaea thermarum]